MRDLFISSPESRIFYLPLEICSPVVKYPKNFGPKYNKIMVANNKMINNFRYDMWPSMYRRNLRIDSFESTLYLMFLNILFWLNFSILFTTTFFLWLKTKYSRKDDFSNFFFKCQTLVRLSRLSRGECVRWCAIRAIRTVDVIKLTRKNPQKFKLTEQNYCADSST